ncbi:unnamed protein product [Rhizophagus irregularis]|nr:unnamed protein product [Rhizophagus irregularis]
MLWESWEIFVANYDAFRTNLLIKRGKKSARLSELYCGSYGTQSTLDIEVELKELSVCSAKEQFPCNILTDKKSSDFIDNNVIVNGASASWGDAFVAREIAQNSNYKYILSIHQWISILISQTAHGMENELPGVGKATAGKSLKLGHIQARMIFITSFSRVKRSIEKYEEENTGKKVKLDFYPFNV